MMREYGRPAMIGLKPSRAVIILLSINVAMVVITGVAAKYLGSEFLVRHLGLRPVSVVNDLELWQPLTYFWLHSLSDPGHLFWNLLTLWLFSGPLERHWGTAGFVRFYLICGIGAGLVVLGAGLLWQPETLTVGASGAILGLVAAFGILYPELPVYIFGVYPIKGRTLAIIFAVVSTGVPLIYRHANVSVAAHIGGLAIGAFYASGYWRPRRLVRRIRLARARRRLRALEGGKGKRSGMGQNDGSNGMLH
jgi:membrane associated rhomboid family serine protease